MKYNYLCALFLLFTLSACVPQPVFYGTGNPQPVAQLVVQADAVVEAVPDQLELRLGVVTQQETAGQALRDNNERMRAVMKQLATMGIAVSEMQTGQFQIRPEWSVPPRPTPANWQRRIVAYQVSNELQITTTRIDLAGDLLGIAQQAGANQIGNLQFSLADPETAQLKAIDLATTKARNKAHTLATAAGVRLGELLSLSLDNSNGFTAPKMMFNEARIAAVDSVPVATGKVDIQAAVTAIYRLQNTQPAQ